MPGTPLFDPVKNSFASANNAAGDQTIDANTLHGLLDDEEELPTEEPEVTAGFDDFEFTNDAAGDQTIDANTLHKLSDDDDLLPTDQLQTAEPEVTAGFDDFEFDDE